MESFVAPDLGIQTPFGRERRSYKSSDCLIGETCFPGPVSSKGSQKRGLFGSAVKALLKGVKKQGIKELKRMAKSGMKDALTEESAN